MSLQKPSENEEEYFARQVIEKKKKEEAEQAATMAATEQQQLRDLHYMHCPKCGHDLVEIELRGTKIDTCTQCEGIWLDAGELEQVSSGQSEGGLFSSVSRLFK